MNGAFENRTARRDQKRHQRRHGQRGGTGKRSKLIQDLWIKRGKEAEKRTASQQPTST